MRRGKGVERLPEGRRRGSGFLRPVFIAFERAYGCRVRKHPREAPRRDGGRTPRTRSPKRRDPSRNTPPDRRTQPQKGLNGPPYGNSRHLGRVAVKKGSNRSERGAVRPPEPDLRNRGLGVESLSNRPALKWVRRPGKASPTSRTGPPPAGNGATVPPAHWSSSAGRPTHVPSKRPAISQHRRIARRTITHPEHAAQPPCHGRTRLLRRTTPVQRPPRRGFPSPPARRSALGT